MQLHTAKISHDFMSLVINHPTVPYLTFGVSSLLNRPLSAEALLKFDPMCIPNVTKVTETSVRLNDNTLHDSSNCKVQVEIM